MKVLPFKIPKSKDEAFIFQINKEVAFYDKLHQHEEIQISLIVEGEGTLLVGDTINYFKKGDVLIIGSNIPHVFKSDIIASATSHMLTLFFTKTSFGLDFFKLEELKALQPFFDRSTLGFKVTSNNKKVKRLFYKLESATKINRFIILLKLIKLCSEAEYKSLSSFINQKNFTANEGHRMRNIFEYTMANFNENLTLETMGQIANMTKNAFCKYFKKRTNKTYFQFLNELRIEYACNLLIKNQDLSIAEIAEKSGFNNISNFNRQFIGLKKLSPSKYRKTITLE